MADHPLRPAMDRRHGKPLPHHLTNPTRAHLKAINLSPYQWAHTVLARISPGCSVPQGKFPRVTHPSATAPEGTVRLACVKPAASVRSEPGSNSQVSSSIRHGHALLDEDTLHHNHQCKLSSTPITIVK